MTTPSDTPRTDAVLESIRANPYNGGCIPKDFARQLERELNEQTASHAVTVGHCDDVIRERDSLKSEVEELRKALGALYKFHWITKDLPHCRQVQLWCAAKEALTKSDAAMKSNRE